MFPKMPGQMVIGQQGAQVMGQHHTMIPQGGMPVRMPQGQTFVGGPQPQLPATLGNSSVRGPGPAGTPAGFFPQGPGMQGPDARLLQERQLQHRMQMAKLQQQQMMMGQQPIPHTGNSQATLVPQTQPGMIGNPVMAQQQVNAQQGMLSNQASQQGMMQVPQGVAGGQTVASLPQNLAGPSIHQAQAMAAQPGMMGNQQVAPKLSEQQRPMQMLNQQGIVGSPGQPGIRGPHSNLTPQQQNILAQRMLASQQQLQLQQQQLQLQQQKSIEKNMIQFQQQLAQKQQPMQVSSQPSQEQGGLSQPSTPQMGSSPCAGSVTPQRQGGSDGQNPCPKESGLLSPESKTPPHHSGPLTPSQGHQVGSANQLQQNQKQDHSNLQKQTGLVGNQQHSVVLQQQQQPPLLALQGQGSVIEDKPSTIKIKEEGKAIDVSAQQQQQQQKAVQNPMMQTQDSSMPLQVIGQPHPGQQQPVMIGGSPQQQALMAQQKQLAMMGAIRAQQQGIAAQRPTLQPGQIRTPVNIQAIIAQNPQLRNLPPNQQIQHIQAIIAQRQLQQGQMLRMSMGQGQIRSHLPPGQVLQVGQQHQSNMLQAGINSQMQQGMMVPRQQQPHAGEMMQNISRSQAPVPPSPVEHGRMAMPASPCQPLANPPGDLQRHAFNQNMAMRPPTPNQNQQALMAAGGRMQGSPSHAYSPRGPFGMSPVHPTSPHSSHASSPSMGDGRAGRGSPYNQVKASPLRSPGTKSPLDSLVLKVETQTSGNEPSHTTLGIPNGPQKGLNIKQQTQQVPEGLCLHAQHVPSGDDPGRFSLQNIKQEPREVHCDSAALAHSKAVKREVTGEAVTSGNNTGFISEGNMSGDPGNQGPRSETGQQLLQKLLKTKNLQLGAQRPSDGIHNEINGHINTKLAMLEQKLQGTPQNMEVCLCGAFLFLL